MNEEFHKQAPLLYHNKEAYSYGNYYQLPQGITDKIFKSLDGRNGSQLKLMLVLLGTIGNGTFRVSQKWVEDHTGLSQPAYVRARKALIDRGWLVLDGGCLAIDIAAIMEEE